ncbi:MAG: hypothetical protein B7Z71_00480 [Acidocella sp. 21-58-7]|nr:MAG: hypothetical protein B7Z71_00480 [Acidocella sp. 21-58-7]HQT65803.1 hypothetical protein [Acidocella sp.]
MSEQPKYITVIVSAPRLPLGKNVTKQRQVGTRMQKKAKSLFSNTLIDVEVPVMESFTEFEPSGKVSTTQIDRAEFAERIAAKLNSLDEKGYEVISMFDFVEGEFNWQNYASPGNAALGMPSTAVSWGYSVTGGVVITAKLKSN